MSQISLILYNEIFDLVKATRIQSMNRSLSGTVNFWDIWFFYKKIKLDQKKCILVKFDFSYRKSKCPSSWQFREVINDNYRTIDDFAIYERLERRWLLDRKFGRYNIRLLDGASMFLLFSLNIVDISEFHTDSQYYVKCVVRIRSFYISRCMSSERY